MNMFHPLFGVYLSLYNYRNYKLYTLFFFSLSPRQILSTCREFVIFFNEKQIPGNKTLKQQNHSCYLLLNIYVHYAAAVPFMPFTSVYSPQHFHKLLFIYKEVTLFYAKFLSDLFKTKFLHFHNLL